MSGNYDQGGLLLSMQGPAAWAHVRVGRGEEVMTLIQTKNEAFNKIFQDFKVDRQVSALSVAAGVGAGGGVGRN